MRGSSSSTLLVLLSGVASAGPPPVKGTTEDSRSLLLIGHRVEYQDVSAGREQALAQMPRESM